MLQDHLDPSDIDAAVADLERRCAEIIDTVGQLTGWAEVASASALGMADAGVLLHQPLRSNHRLRLAAVAGRFAMLAGQALLMLGPIAAARAPLHYALARSRQS